MGSSSARGACHCHLDGDANRGTGKLRAKLVLKQGRVAGAHSEGRGLR